MSMAIPTVVDLYDQALHSVLQNAIHNKTKPKGSLGRIVVLAVQIGQFWVQTNRYSRIRKWWCLPPSLD